MTDSTKSYSEMLKGELLAVARRLGLTNLSRLRKEEIIDLIKRATRKTKKTTATKKPSSTKAPTKSAASTKSTPKTKPATKKVAASKAATPAKKATIGKASSSKATTSKGTSGKTKTTKTTTGSQSTSRKTGKAAVAKKPAADSGARRSLSYGESKRRSSPGPVSAQADAVASKYGKVSEYKPEELQGVDEGLPELPQTSDGNRIVLLPRDPAWLFAYWNLTYEYKEAARAAGGKVLALRLNDVTDLDFDGTNAHSAYEHECAEWARSWYLPVPAPGRDYIVEIGYRGGEDWFPLARSRRVSVPADQPSTWVRNDFVTIGFDEDLKAVRQRMPRMDQPAEPPTAPPVTPQTIYDDGDLRIVVGGPFFNPSGAPSWPLFSHAVLAVPGSVSHLPGSLGHIPGSLGHIPGSLGHIPGSLGHVPGSLGHVPGSLGHLGQLARHPGTPPDAGALGTELEASVFAGQPVLLEDATQPLLQAAVEMVISGRSFPGTEISIAGRGIPTGPDGAFSLRVSVPEGMRDLPIEAKSVESGVTRRLVLRFGRDFDS